MTTTAKRMTVGALLVAGCLGAATEVRAACASRVTLQTFQNQRPPESYAYIDPRVDLDDVVLDSPGLLGRFWEIGARAQFNEGTLPPSAWLYRTKSGINVEARLDAPEVAGCPTPSGVTATLVEAVIEVVTQSLPPPAPPDRVPSPRFAIMTSQGIPANAVAFDLAKLNQNMILFEIPKPALGTVVVGPSSLQYSVSFQPINQGIFGAAGASVVKAYQIVRHVGTPGSVDAADWTFVSEYPSSGGALNGQPLTVDCTGISGQPVFLATRIRFDSNVLSQLVSLPADSTPDTCP